MKLSTIYLAALLVALAIMARICHCRSDQGTCVTQLLPCLRYLNGTHNPSDSCCNSLKSVIKDIPECLCSLISTKGVRQAQRAGINVDEAQQLPGRVGQHVNPIACLTGSASSGNSGESSGGAAFAPLLSMLESFSLAATLHLLGTILDHLV